MVVASVPFLAKYRPVRVPDGLRQQLGQVHHDRARRVHAVADRGLPRGRRLHRRVLVAEHDRAVAAHQVDVLVPVHVPDPRAAAAPHELRVGGARGRLVPVHPARDHGPGALAQLPVGGAVTHAMCSLIVLDPAGHGRLRNAEEVQYLAQVSRSRRPSPGRWRPGRRRRGRARRRLLAWRPASSPASRPAVKPSPQPVVSTTSTSSAGSFTGAPPSCQATRQPSAPSVTATAAVPSARTSLMASARLGAAGEGEDLVAVRHEPVRHGQQRGEPFEVLAGGRGAARRRRRARRCSWPPRRPAPAPRRSSRRARPGRR